jgi:hypothetical protein
LASISDIGTALDILHFTCGSVADHKTHCRRFSEDGSFSQGANAAKDLTQIINNPSSIILNHFEGPSVILSAAKDLAFGIGHSLFDIGHSSSALLLHNFAFYILTFDFLSCPCLPR